jgi:predicted nucleic acid-binding Zn ribbon protein
MRDRPMKRHARAGQTAVTWCGSALDDVLWTTETSEVTCQTCAAILKKEAEKC